MQHFARARVRVQHSRVCPVKGGASLHTACTEAWFAIGCASTCRGAHGADRRAARSSFAPVLCKTEQSARRRCVTQCRAKRAGVRVRLRWSDSAGAVIDSLMVQVRVWGFRARAYVAVEYAGTFPPLTAYGPHNVWD